MYIHICPDVCGYIQVYVYPNMYSDNSNNAQTYLVIATKPISSLSIIVLVYLINMDPVPATRFL